MEFIGEWNDYLFNDIMLLKVIDPLRDGGVSKFVLIGENVPNFHYSDDAYYEEWFDDVMRKTAGLPCSTSEITCWQTCRPSTSIRTSCWAAN